MLISQLTEHTNVQKETFIVICNTLKYLVEVCKLAQDRTLSPDQINPSGWISDSYYEIIDDFKWL